MGSLSHWQTKRIGEHHQHDEAEISINESKQIVKWILCANKMLEYPCFCFEGGRLLKFVSLHLTLERSIKVSLFLLRHLVEWNFGTPDVNYRTFNVHPLASNLPTSLFKHPEKYKFMWNIFSLKLPVLCR